MKGPARHKYKALYQECSRQSADKDRLMAILQSQTTQLASERQMKDQLIASQQQQLAEQENKLSRQEEQLALQQQTILGQDEKLAQQQRVITEQHVLIAVQRKELDQHQKDLFRLEDLRHQLRMYKKMLFGIKSEKRHQPTDPGKTEAGDQLKLLMEVDAWGICLCGW